MGKLVASMLIAPVAGSMADALAGPASTTAIRPSDIIGQAFGLNQSLGNCCPVPIGMVLFKQY
jgi:hypothetical protein